MGGQRQASASLPPGKTRYPFYMRFGGPQVWPGRVRNSRLHRDSISGLSSPWRVAIMTTQPRPSYDSAAVTDNDDDDNNNNNNSNNNTTTTEKRR